MSMPKWFVELQREMAESAAEDAEMANEAKARLAKVEGLLNRVRVELTAGI